VKRAMNCPRMKASTTNGAKSRTDLTVERFPDLPLLPRAWELRDTVSAYDAQ